MFVARFPHALVMALLFHKGDWKAKAVSSNDSLQLDKVERGTERWRADL